MSLILRLMCHYYFLKLHSINAVIQRIRYCNKCCLSKQVAHLWIRSGWWACALAGLAPSQARSSISTSMSTCFLKICMQYRAIHLSYGLIKIYFKNSGMLRHSSIILSWTNGEVILRDDGAVKRA